MEPMIRTKGIVKKFKTGLQEVEVLKGIDLVVENGEFVSIMGPSGSGKSTLLYILGALDSPTSGSVYLKGKDLSNLKDKDISNLRRNTIGFVFQFYNLIPNLSVEENILVPVILEGKSAKSYKQKLKDILEVVDLSNRRLHTPRELSGGQQQRVAIARAIINEPDIILADEPTGNLDSKTGSEILKLLERINKEHKKTIVQVTHSQEASQYGNRIIRVMDGLVC